MALRANGSLVSWGDNEFNQVSATPSGTGFTAVSAGAWHSVAIQAPPAPADETPPVISLTTPADNATYLLGQVVLADYACTDEAGGSGLASCEGTVAHGSAINTATAGAKSFTVDAADHAGNTATVTHPYSVSQAAQTINFTSTPPVPAYVGGSYSVSASGGGSGNPVVFSSLSPGVCTVSGSTVAPDAAGTCVVAANQAGNSDYLAAPQATQSFTISAPPGGFVFSGFFAPVDNLPTVNVAKVGSAIPGKFSLGGDQGLNIFASGYPGSQAIPCDAAAPQGPVEETVTAGSSSLSYDASTGRYAYVWKTEKSWGNSCRRLTLQFTDGTTHSASFRFTK